MLEGAHLERALGVSLIALVVVVLALLAYFIWEPFRGADANEGFKDQSIERGAVLFANASSEEYDSTKSLLCADCHGVDGGGGTANFVIKSEDPLCDPDQMVDAKLAEEQPECLPQQVAWAAPNLQVASLKYDRDAAHPDHHVRPAGHAHARVGCAQRQGRAAGAEHPATS